MAKGGNRVGAGRPKGARNSKTVIQANAAKESGCTPLEYMLSVMRDDKNDPAMRLDAANKAAPYVHAKFAVVDHTSSDGTMTPKAPVYNLAK